MQAGFFSFLTAFCRINSTLSNFIGTFKLSFNGLMVLITFFSLSSPFKWVVDFFASPFFDTYKKRAAKIAHLY